MNASLPSLATALLSSVLLAAGAAGAADWPRWRGPADHGSSATARPPVKWSAADQLAWRVELPGKGCSTPIVWKDCIVLTVPVAGDDAVLCFDANGRKLWQTTVGPERAGRHRNGSGSNPSPVTDGQHIFAYFKSGHLAALDRDGKLLWQDQLQERFGKDTLYWDIGTSPVVTERFVVVAVMHSGNSFLAAFDKTTGKLAWHRPRNYRTPVENDHSYATPLRIRHAGREALLVWGGEHVTAHDAADGAVLWSCGDFNPEAKRNWVVVGTPVITGDIAVIPFGRGIRLFGVKLGGSGDVTLTHKLWTRTDTGTFVTTPAVADGKVYLVRDRGEVECVNPLTGETVWSDTLPKDRASYYSSPFIADGRLYAAREDGVVFVAQITGGFKLLAENSMGEQIIASPVPLGDRLLLRGAKHLFCVAN